MSSVESTQEQSPSGVKEERVYPEIRLFLSKGSRFFGIGPYRLLKQLSQEDSLKSACMGMNISYSKGLRIIGNIEGELGVKIVNRSRGGATHGASQLTDAGRELLAQYERFLAESTAAVESIFQQHFSPWINGLQREE